MKLYELTAHEVRDMLQKGEISAQQILDNIYDRIDSVENKVGAFINFALGKAYDDAEAVDKALAEGQSIGDLAGIPMAIKDNICTKGITTTCASKMLEDFVPPYSAEVYDRLMNSGAIMVGKTNLDEFAMGSSTENSAFKVTKNPWDLQSIPGGSSGGSAAAVAAGEAYYALGTDTGGSIRQPAALCGLVGLKPTYGTVSRYGVVAMASSLDQVGPITKDVEDCALVMNAIYGYDEKDSTSLKVDDVDFRKALVEDVKGLKVGVPREFFQEGVDPEIKDMVLKSVAELEKVGAIVEETSLPYTKYALPAYYMIACGESSSNLSRFDGVRFGRRAEDYKDLVDLYVKSRTEGFGAEVKRRIMLGTYILSAKNYEDCYVKALKARTLIKQDFEKAFEKYDCLITPTSPTTAFRFGEKAKDPMAMYMSDICTVPVNIAGVPAITVPCGLKDGLPVGMQIIGRPLEEMTLLRAAYTFEKMAKVATLRPNL